MEDDTVAPGADWTLPGYTHGRELGEGAAGRVVMARHAATGRLVAIKYLSARLSDTRGLRTEAEVLAGLNSPHITRLYEYVEGPRGAAMVMELVEGVSLRDLLDREGSTSPEAALTVLKGSLLGLAAAHEAQVVHRDYKPGNVLVTPEGRSKLVDFGIAVPAGDRGALAGTPAYMAPEQWAGRPASPATDVYAATATFFECLTGAKPYRGTSLMELAVQHTEADIPAEEAPEALQPIIRAGLAKTVHERPAGAAALVTELDAIVGQTFGEDWEERGRRDLAALVALLPLLLPSAGSDGQAAGTTSLVTTTLGPARAASRLGRRAKIIGVLAGVALVGGALVGIAAAGTGGATGRTRASAVQRTSSPVPGPVVVSPSSPSVSRSPSVSPSVRPKPSPSTSVSAAPPAPATGQPPATAPISVSPTPSPSILTTPTPAPSSSIPTSPAPAPSLHVTSVAVTDVFCNQGVLTATVTVNSDGAADGTLALTWLDSGANGGLVPVATDTITLARGQTSLSQAFSHGFADPSGFWGVRAATTPAAATGQGASGQAPSCQQIS